ncbi:MAG: DNA gyrase subunit A, partial [Buchnera aphidicola]|nr:DNA gyrase subunit A [Buchnera aphidicola]
YIDNNNISLEQLMKYIPGPDFPTKGMINGKIGIKDAYRTGKGKIYIRARKKIEINPKNKKETIVFYEIPYQVNKARLIEKIAELVKDKRIDGISALRDESDKDGMRIVIEIKKEAISDIILNQLYSLTQLQISFGINMVALCQGQPKILSLHDIIKEFLSHRKEIVTKRSIFELNKARSKKHILEGLNIALNNIDHLVDLIKKSKNSMDAKALIMKKKWTSKNIKQLNVSNIDKKIKKNIDNKKYYQFTEKQTQSILDLRLNKLTNLEQKKILLEYHDLMKIIKNLKDILSNPNHMMNIIKEELLLIRNNFKDVRKTEITENQANINIEDLINQENVVVTLSHSGYVKYQPLSDYNAQRRGGKGKSAAKIKEEDFIES